jgi:hypothetical protein
MNKGVLMSKRARVGLLLVIVSLLLLSIHGRTPSLHLPVVPEMSARTKATMEEKRENKALAVSFLNALGYNDSQIKCAITLWTRESRFDHLADNPRSTAYGITQLLRERSGKPELQILHGVRYVEHRYRGSFCSAKGHSDRKGWY